MERQIAPVRLDDLIKAAFTKARRNHERLGREAKRYALRIVQARAPDLPNDIQEEVFTQAFIELFRATPEEVEAIGGKRLFRKAVFKGIRAVRAVYPPAGARTRLNTKRYGDVAAEDIGRIPDQKALERASVEEGGHARLDLHMLADPAATSAF